jgi:multidrug resistance protein MdtO
MSVIDLVRDELLVVSRPRMARMLRMTAVVAFVLMFSMAKRVPEASISAYIIFFIAQRDVATTVGAGIGAVLGLTLALSLVLLCFLLVIGEAALRVPLMVTLAFAGIYLMRSTAAGVLGLLFAFFPFYVLTLVDWVPSPEVLVRAILWLWVVLAYPIGILVLADLTFGTRPTEIYRSGIAERLAAAAAYLGADPDRDTAARTRLARYVHLGAADLEPYVERSGPEDATPTRATLLRQTDLLGFLLRELPDEIRRDPAAQPALRRAGHACEDARKLLLGRDGARPRDFELLAAERRGLGGMAPATRAVVVSLVNCVQTIVLTVRELAREPSVVRTPLIHLPKPRPPASPREGVRFALKVTLAATTAYLIYTGLDWYAIHTATVTCFFVAQDSVGATIHKLSLRIVGAIIGASLGMLALTFVLPGFDSIGGLTVLVSVVTLFAAWIATGSERIAYAGFQIALAFYLTVLQGFGPTTKLYVGRDRIFGILLGNVIMSIVFTSLWPVRAEPARRRELSSATLALATILRTPPDDRAALSRAEVDFYDHIGRARDYQALVRFERERSQRGVVLTLAQGLFVPIHAIAHTPMPASASTAARAALTSANARAADWIAAFATALASQAPAPLPTPESATATLEPIASNENETAETRAHVREQLAYLDLLRAQCAELAAQRPA